MEEAFRELGVKLAETIVGSARAWPLDGADIATLLERLAGLLEYIGRGYQTTEVQDMLNKAYMGYGTRMRAKGRSQGLFVQSVCPSS